MFLLAVSLVCACGDVEPFPGEGDDNKVENENGSGGSDDDNQGGGDQGGSGDEGGNTGDQGGSGNEGGNTGNEGGNEGTQTPSEQAQIVILPTSEGWCTSYPTSQSVYKIDAHEYYLLNAAVYNSGNGMQFKKTTGYIANKSIFGTLVRIEVVKGAAHSGRMLLHIGDTELPTSTEITSTETANGYAFDCTAHNAKYFKLTNDGSGVVYLSEIRITYLTSGNNPSGGDQGGSGNEGDQGGSGNEGGNEGGEGGGTTPDPDPTPDPHPDPNPDPSTGNIYRSGGAELPVETENPDYYYAHHICAGSEQNAQRNGKARNYTVCYSANHHCPVWVAAPRHACYEGSANRTDAYQKDPAIPSSIQYDSKSTGGGCNKGHMLGSAERTSSSATNRQVFYYTNIAPQYSDSFNTGGGAWNNLEDYVDDLICPDTLYIVVGCHFDKFTDKLGNTASPAKISFGGRSDVSRPTMFYYALLRTKNGNSKKSVMNCSAEELQCAAFVKCHEAPKGSKVTSQDMMSISELEELVGVTLFPNVPNAPKSTYKASDWGL